MPFPDSPRVVYAKNTLDTVICQLRFPPILRIEAESPAVFQDIIRQEYPLFEERALSLPNLPQEIVGLIPAGLDVALRTAKGGYEFGSADGRWVVSLTRDSLSLTSRHYERWEDFKEHFDTPLQALKEHYVPAFFSRVGLRYRNVIRKGELGLADVDWSELLAPHITGELASRSIADAIEHAARQVTIRLKDGGRVNLQHGLVRGVETDEAYVLDSDFFTEERTEVGDVLKSLDYYNRQAGRLFRWCISQRLHSAMDPRPIEQD